FLIVRAVPRPLSAPVLPAREVATLTRAGSPRRGRTRSALDRVTESLEDGADPVPHLALQLDARLRDGAARPALALEPCRQLLQEGVVPGQIVEDRHRLAAASLLLDPKLGDDARGEWLGRRAPLAAAHAGALRPATDRALAVGGGGVDRADVVFRAHGRLDVRSIRPGGRS